MRKTNLRMKDQGVSRNGLKWLECGLEGEGGREMMWKYLVSYLLCGVGFDIWHTRPRLP